MSIETKFWSHVDQLRNQISRTERKMPLSAKEYEVLFSSIHDIFGDWQAGNFVKMCASLKKGDVESVAQGLLDLKKHGWIYSNILKEEDRRYEAAPQRRSYDYLFNDRSFVRRKQIVTGAMTKITSMTWTKRATVSSASAVSF